MKPSIPQIQGYMRSIADDCQMAGLYEKARLLRRYATQLSRVKSVRKAPKRCPMPTPQQVLAVRAYRSTHPDMSYREIANKFKVGNDGRVSEIIRGKRGRRVYNGFGRRIKGR